MSIHKILSPIPSKMTVEPGQGGHIKKLETSIKNVNFEKDDLLSSPSAPTEEPTIGESLLDVICVKHSSKPGNITLDEDRLCTIIIGELSLKYYLKDNQGKNPVVRRVYAEVQEIDRVSYRSLSILTKVGERHVPITAQIIPGLVMPLLVGMDFRDTHIECPTLQKQVNELNSPRIYFFKDKQVPRMSLNQVRHIHRYMDHPDHAQMTTECTRLGHKVDRIVELQISRIIQEYQVCKNKSRLFSQGYTPHQLVYGITSGLPGIFQLPRNLDTVFAGSVQRLISGFHHPQERGAPMPYTHGR